MVLVTCAIGGCEQPVQTATLMYVLRKKAVHQPCYIHTPLLQSTHPRCIHMNQVLTPMPLLPSVSCRKGTRKVP
jgi:hypothetical protein